jgi:hypothetical protein
LAIRFEECLFLAVMSQRGWARWSGPWEESVGLALKMAEAKHPKLQFSIIKGRDLGTENGIEP